MVILFYFFLFLKTIKQLNSCDWPFMVNCRWIENWFYTWLHEHVRCNVWSNKPLLEPRNVPFFKAVFFLWFVFNFIVAVNVLFDLFWRHKNIIVTHLCHKFGHSTSYVTKKKRHWHISIYRSCYNLLETVSYKLKKYLFLSLKCIHIRSHCSSWKHERAKSALSTSLSKIDCHDYMNEISGQQWLQHNNQWHNKYSDSLFDWNVV